MARGLSELSDAYDVFVVDQWGVLHEGDRAYPEAVSCLEALRDAGKRVVVLTNSGRRADANRKRMIERGIGADLFAAVVSSGEEAWQSLRARSDPWYAGLGRKCVFVSRQDDTGYIDGLGLEAVARIDEADFILLTGTDAPGVTIEAYEPVLSGGIARGLPMVCANPDTVFPQDGTVVFGPGALAAIYQELGGDVRLHGKPSPSVFRTCIEAAGDVDPGRVLVVGDSIFHDIAGARAAGLASALVASGIHVEDLGIRRGQPPSQEAVSQLCGAAETWPDWVVPTFAW